MHEFLSKLNEFCNAAEAGVEERWAKLPVEIADGEEWEAVGGLLARQATICTQLAMAPTIWNPHIAPILVRSMIDCYITLRWVLSDPAKNAKDYVLYGLGQHKLFLEHLRSRAEEDPGLNRFIQLEETWLNNQRADYVTTVDLGKLGDKSTWTMAQEAGCEDLYKFPFSRFSGVAHNMWQHVGRFNLEVCDNPLHKYHRVPVMPVFEPDLDWVRQAAKHLTRSFEAVDEKYGLSVDAPMPLSHLLGLFGQTEDEVPQDEGF